MNPFQLQAEFARQWFDLASSMASSAMSATTMLSQHLTSGWMRAMAAPGSNAYGSWPTNLWQGFAQPAASAPMPFANPFLASANPANWLMPPWFQAPAWQAPTPFSMGLTAPIPVTWAWPWNSAWSAMPWFAAGSRPSNPGADLIEQVAANYRSASGYAVAAVLGPFGTALDPRTFGQPWWQSAPRRNLLN